MGFFLRVLLTVSVLMGMGCAKDRDVEDYKRELAERDAAAYNAVNGHYTGLVRSPENKVIGAVDINLQTRFKTTQNTDGSSSIGTPVLVLELTFEDTRIITVSASDGSYDPNSGLYQANIPLQVHLGTSSSQTTQQVVSVVAHVGGGAISGTIQALGYGAYGNSFSASMNGPSLDDLASQNNVHGTGPSSDVLQTTSYMGATSFMHGTVSKPVQIVVLQPRLGGDDDFYDLMVPVKFVQVSFNYDSSAHILSTNARWDLRSGLLTGQVSIPIQNGTPGLLGGGNAGVTVTLTFDCSASDAGDHGTLSCNHYSNQATGKAATTTGTLEATPGPDPIDDTSTAAAIDRTYHGYIKDTTASNSDVQGNWEAADYMETMAARRPPRPRPRPRPAPPVHTSPTQPPATDPYPGRQISLYVSYAARSRLQDIYDLYVPNAQKAVQVTFMYSDSESVGFTDALWDSSTGALDATNSPLLSPISPGHPLWLPEIHCHDFYFDKQTRPFTCIYKSNRSPQMLMTMQPR